MDTVNKEWNVKVDFITFYKFSVTENKLLEKVYDEYMEQSYIQHREWFNIGFRLGASLVMEVCGR